MRNFMEWVLAEAETRQTGKEDVLTYLLRAWNPLGSRGNYFVYIPDVEQNPDWQGAPPPTHYEPQYARGLSGRRDVPNFSFRHKGTEAIGINQFLRRGLSYAGQNMILAEKHPAILLTLTPNARIQCLDEKSTSDSNPWQWVNIRLRDFEQYAKSLQLPPDVRNHIDVEIAAIKHQVDSWYRRGVNYNQAHPADFDYTDDETKENEQKRIQKLLWLINVEMPRLIGHYQGAKDMADIGRWNYWRNRDVAPPPKQFKGLDYAEIDVLSHSCPISDSQWVLIFNPKVLRRVDSVIVDNNFRGLRQLDRRVDDSPFVNQAPASRQEDSMRTKIHDAIQACATIMDHILGDEIYFNGSDRMMRRKKELLKRLSYAKIVATTLAKDQPAHKEELIEQFQHLLDQFQPEIDNMQDTLDKARGEENRNTRFNLSVEELEKENEHWKEIGAAFKDAIESIRKA